MFQLCDFWRQNIGKKCARKMLMKLTPADSIFTGRMYPKLLKDLQSNDSSAAFINSTLPKWYVDANEPTTQTGINKGLSFMLDAHTDLLSASSIDRDYKGFTGLVSYKGSFPLVYQRGFQIRPGHNNLISIGATMIEASQNLRSLEPWRRKCLFHDETQNLTIYKEYTQSNCFLECSLKYAQEHVLKKRNESCNPWFFPIIKSSPTLCDPWETVEFLSATHDTPDSRCDYCLPSWCQFHQCSTSSFYVQRSQKRKKIPTT